MRSSLIRTARDYNRSLVWPVRAAHVGVAVVRSVIEPVIRWFTSPRRRAWAIPLAILILAPIVLAPFDDDVARLSRDLRPGGDLRRELSAWQQYGALGSLVFVTAAIWLLDPRRVRRCLDLFVAAGLASGLCLILKMFVGRPRPHFGDSATFLGPLGLYPIAGPEGRPVLAHAWEIWGPNADYLKAQLWSFPSSHTAAAAVLSVFLWRVQPRLAPLAAFMLLLVGLSRVLIGEHGAHWMSDVVAGAAAGFLVGYPAVTRHWGVRLLDSAWLALVDRSAMPALPALEAYERHRAKLSLARRSALSRAQFDRRDSALAAK